MEGIGISESAMISLVRDILDGEDFKSITPKIVRERVLKTLKNPKIDMSLLKSSVKSALDIVLVEYRKETDAPAVESSPNKGELPIDNVSGEKKPVDMQPLGDKPCLKTEKVESRDEEDAEAPKSVLDKQNSEKAMGKGTEDGGDDTVLTDKPDKSLVDETVVKIRTSDQQGSVDNIGNDDDKSKLGKPVSKRTSLDSDVAADEEPTKKRVRSTVSTEAKKGKSKVSEEDDISFSNDDFESDDSEKAKPTRRRKAPESEKLKKATRKRSHQTVKSSNESELEKLHSVLRAVGLRIGTLKLKGKTAEGKCHAILEYLKSKGVNESHPTKLTKRELDRHRRRLEREKDMADIDVSNIIEEGRRTRRKAAPLLINPERKDELPSDLSGPDLSEGDDGDDGDEYAALSDESN